MYSQIWDNDHLRKVTNSQQCPLFLDPNLILHNINDLLTMVFIIGSRGRSLHTSLNVDLLILSEKANAFK
jgi:hypothetical protein